MPDLRVSLANQATRRWEGRTDQAHRFDADDSIPSQSTFTLWELTDRVYLVELVPPGRDSNKDYILLAKLYRTGREDRNGRRWYFGTTNTRLIGVVPRATQFKAFYNDRTNSFDLYVGNE